MRREDVETGVESFLRAGVSAKRLAHSLSTAEFARSIAKAAGLDPERAGLAGLAHDMAKGISAEVQLRLARRCDFRLRSGGGPGLGALLLDKPELRHGPAAEMILRESFGLADEEVLEAVRWHSLGRTGMGGLARVVFLADKAEPGRKGVGKELRDVCLSGDLDAAIAATLERAERKYGAQGLAPESRELYLEVTRKSGEDAQAR
jgi:nicotinate-nucleotide adenylyltransferase